MPVSTGGWVGASIPLLTTEASLGARLTPKLEQLLRIWEMVQIERFVPVGRGWVGRPARERTALARAFVAKAVLGLPTTVALIERLHVDACLRRLCDFDGRRKLPGAWLFSRAFAALAAQKVEASPIERATQPVRRAFSRELPPGAARNQGAWQCIARAA